MQTHRTQVAIIGSGPSGLLLGQLLTGIGVDNIVIDRVSEDYILGRIRAGVLEWGTVSMLDQAGVGARMHAEGLPHDGLTLTHSGKSHRIDLKKLTGKRVMVYGQTEVTHDLMDARHASGATSFYEVSNARPEEFDGEKPAVTFEKDGKTHRIEADFIAGCDGYHGPSRRAVPQGSIRNYERVYPFGWLGILSDVPPVSHELIYSNHKRGSN